MGSAAPGQMKGYIYQIQASFLHFLENMASFSSDTLIRLENFDDIDFSASDEEPKTILQTKHSQKTGHLTDGSKDFWKTLSNWIDLCNKESFWQGKMPLFYLITTDQVGKDSIAWYLTETHRDIEKAFKKINDVILKKSSVAQKYAPKYTALDDTQKKELLKQIYVIPNSPNSSDIEKKISQHLLNGGALPNSTDSLRQEFIDWWYGESIRSLSKKDPPFTKRMLESKLQELQSKNTKKLPIMKNCGKTPNPNSVYLKQLDIINYQTQKENAREQFCWAFAHRASWLENGVVTDTELQDYSKRLFTVWRGHKGSSDYNNKQNDQSKGQFLYDQCVLYYKDHHIPLHDCNMSELLQGSYQILANDKKIGWHPDYKNKL